MTDFFYLLAFGALAVFFIGMLIENEAPQGQ